MNEVEQALTPICPRVEKELKPHLRGLFGGMVRGYLPQTWAFSTERGEATLYVDSSGNAKVLSGAASKADVSIRWTQAQLEWAIVREGQGPRPPGVNPQVNAHTPKGSTAFGFLRSRFKL